MSALLVKLCNKLRRVKFSYVLADAPRQRTHRIDRVLADLCWKKSKRSGRRRFAANKSCIRDVAGRFEVGESTHHRMMYRVMDFLLDIALRIVTFPDDMEKLSNDFKQGLADELKFVFMHFAAYLAFLNALSSPLGVPHLLFFF
ncbi:hypothetical protein MRX96_047891 [Rhipicephalus microplus]